MFDDPGKSAEDNMSNALGCGIVGIAVVVLLVIGALVLIVMAL